MPRGRSGKQFPANWAGRGIAKGFDGPPTAGCKFIEASDWRERMMRGEPVYCGAPVHAPGSAWCEHHHSIVYIPDSAAPASAIERIARFVQWRARA